MATHDYIISNASGAAVRADLNNALAAIATNNSSATEPTTTYAYQWWADTGSSPTVMKLRNAANSGWITLFQLDGEWTVVPFENGTAAAPSIYFKDSGTDTGIYSPGTDQVAITTGGTGRLFVTSSGSVGIGTSAPSNRLHVEDTSGSAQLRITGTGGYTQLYSDGNFYIQPNGSTKMVVQSGGNVGIGTTTVNRPLVVFNDSVAALSLNNTTTGIAGGDGFQIQLVGSDGYVFNYEAAPVIFGTAATERARIDSSGRLLLGTSSAIAALEPSIQTARSSGAFLALGRDDTSITDDELLGAIYFYGNQGSSWSNSARIEAKADAAWGTNDYPSKLVFSTTADGTSSPTERMRITNTGRAYFNTGGSAPSSTVYGVQIGAPGDNFWSSSASTTTSYNQFAFWNPNGVVGTINTSGSATAYNTSSDYRLKENISAVTDGITRLQQLKPSRFNFIADPDKTVDGFIAHEVQAVVPEAITGEKDAVDEDGNPIYQGIDQSKLVPLLTAALQEAIGRIESLEAEVAALKAQ